MPILGVVASSRRVVASAVETIATITISSGTSTVTFSSIPQTYKHLEIHGWAIQASGAGIQDINIGFNGDTTSSMRNHWGWGFANNATIYSNSGTATGSVSIGYIPNDTGNNAGGLYISLMDYTSTTKRKLVRYLTGNSGGAQPVLNRGSAEIASTAAVSSISLSSSNITAGVLTLYGFKES